MGFFTKLFGLGWLVARDVEKSLASDTVSDELEMERKLPNTDISNLPFWNKFFDVDLKKSPDELWIETEKVSTAKEKCEHSSKNFTLIRISKQLKHMW